ncbi:DUF2577 domain-containing protein [Paenibacillus campinasensis]|uniref:DUF2577 domain-containing protein n=1 Tax=Paenibacillus campinasensis TaxID=66347 RepID=A0ABW9SZV2_9BACL|nr:DUF2577 domain-containing protein [Paenibacillus campinasensis]MUG66550.1 DUF2577 domain-containing protein [Paenibacillus campinasensis]
MLDIIKKASLSAVGSTNPVTVLYGTVTNTHPLEVNVDQRFSLTEDFLVVGESLTEYKRNIAGEEVVIRRGLQTGDTVVLLRYQGGQTYLVLDRLVKPS